MILKQNYAKKKLLSSKIIPVLLIYELYNVGTYSEGISDYQTSLYSMLSENENIYKAEMNDTIVP